MKAAGPLALGERTLHEKTIPKLLTLVCLLAALMGLSIVTAHAETVTGTISGGNEYRYHEDKTPVSQWGAFTSTKLKYFTRDDTGATVPAYCMEPSVRSPQGDAEYSSVSWSGLSWNQRYAVTLAMAYGYGGNYGFDMHPDCAQLATQAIIWEFVCGYRGTTYPYTLYDTTCKELFHYAGDDVAVAYDIIIDRIMQHGTIPSFAVRYRNQLSDSNAIQLTWDGSQIHRDGHRHQRRAVAVSFSRQHQRCDHQPAAQRADGHGYQRGRGAAERLRQQRLRLLIGCRGHGVRAAGAQQRQQLSGVCRADHLARSRVGVCAF